MRTFSRIIAAGLVLAGSVITLQSVITEASATPTTSLVATVFCNGSVPGIRNELSERRYGGYELSGHVTGLISGHTYLWHDNNGNSAAGYANLGIADAQGVVTVVAAVPIDDALPPNRALQQGEILDQTAQAQPVMAVSAPFVNSCRVLVADTRYAALVNGSVRLVQQGDGNLVLYRAGRAIWQSHTYPHPGAIATLQTDGNLVVRDAHGTGRPLWYTGTQGNLLAYLILQDDGNLVLYSGTAPNRALWQSHTYL